MPNDHLQKQVKSIEILPCVDVNECDEGTVILMLLEVTQWVCTCVLGYSGDCFNCTSMLINMFMPSATNDLYNT